MKHLLSFLAAALLFSAVAGERYLLETGEKFGEVEFEQEYFKNSSGSFRVVDRNGKSVPQTALRDYARFKRIRFSVPDGCRELFLEAGKNDGEKLSDGAGELLDFSRMKWKGSVPEVKRTADGFAVTAPVRFSRPYIESEQIALPEHNGSRVVFEYEGVSKALHPWTIRIQLLQFDKNGKQLPCSAVDERWLNFYTSPQKIQHIRQGGRLDKRAAKIAVRVHLHLFRADGDEMGLPPRKGAVLLPSVKINTFSLRLGEKCHPGGRNKKIFASDGLLLDGKSGTAFNPAGAELWSEGKYITDAKEFAFPLETGSVEIDFTPENNRRKYTILDTHRQDDRLRKKALAIEVDPLKKSLAVTFPGAAAVTFPAEIPTGKRCRIALEWGGNQAVCYLNGKEIAKIPFDGKKFFNLNVKNNQHIPENIGVGMSAQALYIDANRPDDAAQFMKGTLHAARFSNIRRGGFTGKLVCDSNTSALFDYSKSIDAVAGTGRGFVSGVWYGREPLETPIPYVAAQPQLPYPEHDVYPEPPVKQDFAVSRVKCEERFTMVPGKSYTVNCSTAPRMEYIEIACPEDEKEIVHPLVRKPDDVDCRSFGAIRRDLKLDGLDDAQKASKIYKYLLNITDYFIQHPVSYPMPYRSDMSDYDPLAMINNYIGEDCGPENFTTLSLFSTLAGFPSTLTAGNGHSFEQTFFDGSWQVWDLSAEQFMRSRDPRRGASLEELERDPYLFRLSNYFSIPAGFIRTRKRHNGFFPDIARKIVGYRLRNGEKFRINWKNNLVNNNLQCAPHLSISEPVTDRTDMLKVQWPVKEVPWRVPPEFSTGEFICNVTPAEKSHLFKKGDGYFTYEFLSAHPMTNVSVKTLPAAQVEYSFDSGKSYVKDPEIFVKGRRQIIIKVKADLESIKHFSSDICVQMNTRSLCGKLTSGRNDFSIDLYKGSKADVKIGWSVDDKPLEVEGTLSCGVAKGWEKHLLVLDPDGKFSGAVSGVSADAKVTVSSGISAGIENGKLVVSAKENVNNTLESLKITDGKREKDFTVLVSRKSRLHTAKKVKVRNGAKVEDGVIKFTAPEQYAVFKQDKLPAGKYSTLVLFNMYVPNEGRDPRLLALSGVSENFEVVARIRNLATEFFIVRYSKPHYKWDFSQQGRYAYSRVKVYDTKPSKKLTLKSLPAVKAKEGVICDVAAVLLLDASDDEFVIELVKYLTVANGYKW